MPDDPDPLTDSPAGRSTAGDVPAQAAFQAPYADGAVPACPGEITALLARLAEAVGREHERAAHRERVIDRLHDDNERLRHGETQSILDPVRASLYRLHDTVRREAQREAIDPAHVPALLGAIADELAEALARTGVERLPVEAGDPFDPCRHRPTGTEAVDDAGLDGTIITVQRTGFMRGDTVVRRAEVIVARAATDPDGGD